MRLLVSVVLCLCFGTLAHAADLPFLSPLFSDNMVVQRGRPVMLWGWTSPGATVTVSVAQEASHLLSSDRGRAPAAKAQTVKGYADGSGKWTVRMRPLPVGGPYRFTISGPRTITIQNVLAGDVWVCSGQSNMEMGIANVNNAPAEIAAANYPGIRLFTVAKRISLRPESSLMAPRSDLTSQWSVCTPATIKTGGWGGFSAAGYFFGRKLHQDLKVPIGLIHTSWGGTIAEAWTSAEALQRLPDFRGAVAAVQQAAAQSADAAPVYEKQLTAWYDRNDPGTKAVGTWAAESLNTDGWKEMQLPTNWEAAGLPGYDGVVWFRKEIDLPASAAGAAGTLHLGPIDDMDTTWVNGVRVGGLEQWDLLRDYKIPAGVLKAGRNLVAVRVLDTGGNGGIYGKPEQLRLEIPGQPDRSLAGKWSYRASIELNKASALPQRVDNNPNIATVLYNGMIAPLIPLPIKGVIWYQGESNAGRAYQYRTLLPALIQNWRSKWASGSFPFLIVQLASFMPRKNVPGDDEWAELREAQSMTAQRVPNTAEAVIIDIGDAMDIHPKDKQDVGLRLALAAEAIGYRLPLEYSGPVFRSMAIEGHQLRLSFDHASGGLVGRSPNLEGFAIAGEDRRWVWADAHIEGDTVVLSSPAVPQPAAARYAWAANPPASLCNGAGLPASPFRTDKWPGITVNAH